MRLLLSSVLLAIGAVGCSSMPANSPSSKRTPAAVEKAPAKYCYEKRNGFCHTLVPEETGIIIDVEKTSYSKAYVTINQFGMNSCMATVEFAGQVGLSLQEIKQLIAMPNTLTTCKPNKKFGGQMEVVSITEGVQTRDIKSDD